MRHSRWLLILTVAASAASLAAQQAATEPAASREDVQKLFVAMKVRDQMRTVMDSMVQQQSQMMRESLQKRSPGMSEADLQRLETVMHEMMKEFPFTAMLNDMIPVYQKHLTKADVAAMTEFYSSATGKKLLREMPKMTSESMQAAYPTMEAYMEKVMARVDEMAKEKQQKKAAPEKK